jgi:hypothetical protein
VTDFIEVYENAFSKDFCERVISSFEKLDSLGYCHNRQYFNDMDKLSKDDVSIHTTALLAEPKQASDFLYIDSMAGDIGEKFNTAFWETCYKQYAQKYAALGLAQQHGINGNKVQRTAPGEGYHTWHFEAGNKATSDRILAYIVYLNDVTDGGETEFLYQRKRISPQAGSCVIWPSGFTHTHRGNPPLSETKYVLTGWLEF